MHLRYEYIPWPQADGYIQIEGVINWVFQSSIHWGKGESKSSRDNTMTFYCVLEVVALFLALGPLHFSFYRSVPSLAFLASEVVHCLCLVCSLIPFAHFIAKTLPARHDPTYVAPDHVFFLLDHVFFLPDHVFFLDILYISECCSTLYVGLTGIHSSDTNAKVYRDGSTFFKTFFSLKDDEQTNRQKSTSL